MPIAILATKCFHQQTSKNWQRQSLLIIAYQGNDKQDNINILLTLNVANGSFLLFFKNSILFIKLVSHFKLIFFAPWKQLSSFDYTTFPTLQFQGYHFACNGTELMQSGTKTFYLAVIWGNKLGCLFCCLALEKCQEPRGWPLLRLIS